MGIYRGPGGTGDAVNDAASEALITIQARDAALAAQAAAEAAQTAAELAETNAETAETNAETAETNAETAATNAASSASAASTSASNAASSASAASTSASNASTSASNAASSASAASTSASNAASSASAASTSASNASTSATNAANSATAAQVAQAAAEAALDQFDDTYLGAKSSNPTVDNDGNALTTGDQYFNTVANELRIWNGSSWQAASTVGGTVSSLTVTGAFAANGGATLGDASGDALTINSSAVSIPNGLNFDSNTLVIDATNDRVGVGVASPVYPLDLQANSSAFSLNIRGRSADGISLIRFARNNNTDEEARILAYNDGTFAISNTTAQTERMRITSGGLVGIGTSSPTTRLQIGDTTVSADNILKFGKTASAAQSTLPYISQVSESSAGTSNDLQLFAGGSGAGRIILNSYDFVVKTGGGTSPSGTERLRIDSSGNVGIGTNSPSSFNSSGLPLVVGSGSGNTGLTIYSGTAASGSIHFADGTSGNDSFRGYVNYNHSTNSMQFATDATERMRIASTGLVSMGSTTTPLSSTVRLSLVGSLSGGASCMQQFTYNGGTFGGSLIGSVDQGGGFQVYTFTGNVGAETYTERMRITSTGLVGIGTSSPLAGYNLTLGSGTAAVNAALNIDGGTDNAKGSGIRFAKGSTAFGFIGAASWMEGGTSNNLGFSATSTAAVQMRLDSSGNLGLGVTPSAWWSSTRALQIGNSSSLNDFSSSGNRQTTLANNAFLNSTPAWTYINTDPASRYHQTGGQHQWFNAPSGTAGNAITFTQAMTLDASGNLGIGTTSPAFKLEVKSTGSTTAQFERTDGVYSLSLKGSGTTANGALGMSTNDMVFLANSAERMRIDSSGNVSIGATSGNGRLNVVVPSAASSGQTPFFVSDATQASFSIQLGTELVRFTTGTSDALTIETNSAERMRILSAGDVCIGTTSQQGSARLSVARSTAGECIRWTDGATGGAITTVASFGTNLNSDAFSFTTSSTERMRISSGGDVLVNGTVAAASTGGLTLNNATSGSAATPLALRCSGTANGSGSQISFRGVSNTSAEHDYGYIGVVADDTTAKTGSMRFSTTAGSSPLERMRITSAGNLLINTTANLTFAARLQVDNSGENAASFRCTSNNFPIVCHNSTTSGTRNLVYFAASASTNVGTITSDGTGTSYNSNSDYRLKENIAPMTGALAKVAQLKPCTYTWKSNGSAGQGFIAHELQEIVPDAVVGEKDAVDKDGNPVYQGIDTSFLVATLTAAIQEQQAMIEELKQEVALLKSK